MNAAEYLARVGFDALLGTSATPENEDEPASIEAARLFDHNRVLGLLLSEKPRPRAADFLGVHWLDRTISWPDRVPGLVTWSGNQKLPALIAKRQQLLQEAPLGVNLFTFRAALQGASGIDALSCQDSVDVGFSAAALGMPVMQRPAIELLAIIGLETLPIVSYATRGCGFFHDGRLWRFTVEPRDGGYYHRWGSLREVPG